MKRIAALLLLLLLTTGCGGAATGSSSAGASRAIVITSTDTPGPQPTSSGPADPVSTVLTPFATSTPGPSTAVAIQTPAASAANQVRIQDFGFTPPTLNISIGTRLSWTNTGPSNHTITANDGSFDSSTIQRNATFNFTFSKAGTFAYHCSIHPTMLGTITVS
ncbi:MAG: cupredoxin domain-containing protein [Chloroflexota bacterium]